MDAIIAQTQESYLRDIADMEELIHRIETNIMEHYDKCVASHNRQHERLVTLKRWGYAVEVLFAILMIVAFGGTAVAWVHGYVAPPLFYPFMLFLGVFSVSCGTHNTYLTGTPLGLIEWLQKDHVRGINETTDRHIYYKTRMRNIRKNVEWDLAILRDDLNHFNTLCERIVPHYMN